MIFFSRFIERRVEWTDNDDAFKIQIYSQMKDLFKNIFIPFYPI